MVCDFVRCQLQLQEKAPNVHNTHLNEGCKSRICALLFLKFIFPIQLMRSIRHEWAKQGHNINEDISDALDNGVCLLALIQGIAQARVYADNLLDVPEDLLDKVSSSLGGDDVVVFEVADPHL